MPDFVSRRQEMLNTGLISKFIPGGRKPFRIQSFPCINSIRQYGICVRWNYQLLHSVGYFVVISYPHEIIKFVIHDSRFFAANTHKAFKFAFWIYPRHINQFPHETVLFCFSPRFRRFVSTGAILPLIPQ